MLYLHHRLQIENNLPQHPVLAVWQTVENKYNVGIITFKQIYIQI